MSLSRMWIICGACLALSILSGSSASDSQAGLRLRQMNRLTSTTPAAIPAAMPPTISHEEDLQQEQEEDKLEDSQPSTGKHKRGIFHGHGHFPARTYAAHYGYSLQLPGGAATFVAAHRPHSFVKYSTSQLPGLHYRPLAAVPAAAAVPSAGFLPAAALTPAVSAAAPSYVLRPGNAFVSSYSVNYPHQPQLHKPLVGVKPVHFHAQVQPVQPTFVQTLAPAPPQLPTHTFALPAPVPSVPVAQPAAALPVAPSVAFEFPSIPQFPAQPAVPTFAAAPVPAAPEVTVPQVPQIPQIPEIPQIPAIPQIPQIPAIPQIPQFPGFPQLPQAVPAQAPAVPAFTSQFFPAAVQPPLPQQPPTFIQPEAQFPGGIVPLPGSVPVQPDSGTAIASPQIPQGPQLPPAQIPIVPEAEPELPTPAAAPLPTQPTPQQPWKPVFFQPAATPAPNRPAITLLPPYGRAPAEGYLPPVTAPSQQLSQSHHGIFDQLSDAEIEHIFAQANLAHHHHQQQHHGSYNQW